MGHCCAKYEDINKQQVSDKSSNHIELNEIVGIRLIFKSEKTLVFSGFINNREYLIKKKKYSKSRLIRQKNEINILNSLNSEYIIKYYTSYKDDNNIYSIFNYDEGVDLYDYFIEKNNFINENILRTIILQLCHGVNHIHYNGIIHRDIKPENIIIYQNNKIKIIDFDLAIKEEDVKKDNKLCGTKNYISPNYINTQISDYSDDIWSIGITTYVLINQHFPFTESFYFDRFKQLNQKLQFNFKCTKQFKQFMNDTTERERFYRINSNNLINHNWFNLYMI
jgi:serine/threonine protein kinase